VGEERQLKEWCEEKLTLRLIYAKEIPKAYVKTKQSSNYFIAESAQK